MISHNIPSHQNSEQLICPFCGKAQACHIPEEISSHISLEECEFCHEDFWFAVTVTRTYSVYENQEELV